MSDVKMKRCKSGDNCLHPNGCQQPATSEYFGIGMNNIGGLRHYCRKCDTKEAKHKRAEKRKLKKELHALSEHRACRLCQESKPLIEFRHKNNASNSSGKSSARIKTCKECEVKIANGLQFCASCKTWQPHTEGYFHKSRRYSGGLNITCKACRNDENQRRKLSKEAYDFFIRRRDMESKGYKYCPKCETFKPAGTDHFYYDKNDPNMLRAYCVDCERQYYHDNQPLTPKRKRKRERDKLRQRGLKRCTCCNEIKSYDEFSEYRRSWDGYQYWCNTCKRNEYAENREHYAEKGREWSKANSEKVRSIKRKYKVKRRQQRNNLPYHFDETLFGRMLGYWDHTCAYCGAKPDMFISLQADHWIPISSDACPGTIPTNMLPACSSVQPIDGHIGCNQSKQNKDPEQWLIERFGKREKKQILKRIQDYFDWVQDSD